MSSDNRVIAVAAAAGAAAGAIAAVAITQAKLQGVSSGPALGREASGHVDGEHSNIFKGKVTESRSARSGEGARWTKPIVIAPPALEDLGAKLATRLGCEKFEDADGPTISLKRFKSNDPDIKFNWKRVIGHHVVFLFDTVDQNILFDQMALLQALQGFAVPDGDDKSTKWKTYVDRGKYSWGRASHVTIVIPWYRPCQMERTSRWQLQDGNWTNADPKGQWLDVPSAQYYARLLCTPGSVPPLPGPSASLDGMPLNPLWRPPVELLFVELHEEVPVSHSVSDLGATIRTERFVPYFLDKFKGKRAYPGKANMYVLFPDRGAFNRYSSSVYQVLSLDCDHVLYIEKSRTGETITTKEQLFYVDGERQGEKTKFMATDEVIIIDDFTNSGSTLFNAVNLVKKMCTGNDGMKVNIFVSHLVATYDPKVVQGLLEKLHNMGSQTRFFCTNSIPSTTNILKDDPQVEVVDISDFICDMVQ